MEWGIIMAVTTVLGMMGVAVFESTSENSSQTSPEAKHVGEANESERKKAA